MKKIALILCIVSSMQFAFAQNNSGVKLGAYYYDGLNQANSPFLTKSLLEDYPERKPLWGWGNSNPDMMKNQIDMAADAGLNFFSFDWYIPDPKRPESKFLNKDLALFQQAPNRGRLNFTLMVANHSGYRVGPGDWKTDVDTWVALFKSSNYLRANGKPLITFFSVGDMLATFKTIDAIKQALDSLRSVARQNGLGGVTVALCVSPDPSSVARAKACGFDVFTAYNYPGVGFKGSAIVNSSDDLLNGNEHVWNRFFNFGLPYIPVATLNWDPRPWRKTAVPYYGLYSAQTVYKSVKALKDWIINNPRYVTREKIGVIYAWNEYGEGAWLTPSAKLTPLDGFKRAVAER